MIIFEGPDGAGKTSLSVRLSKELGIPIADKVVASNLQPLTDLAVWTEQNVAQGFQRMIFDRHRLISEPIYGPATRAKQDPKFCDPGWMLDMMAQFYASNPIIIYCLPSLRDVWHNVHNDETDNTAVRSRIRAIYAGYAARASIDISRGVGRLYDYRTTHYDDIKGWLIAQLDNRIKGAPYVQSDHPVRGRQHLLGAAGR